MGTPVHLTIQELETLGRVAEWAQNDILVLKQKDTEQHSCQQLHCPRSDDRF